MSRRGNNEGSIFKRKDGRWVARVSLGGGRIRDQYASTRTEAAAKLASALKAKQDGLPLDTSARLTVGQFLTRWLEESARSRVRESTFISYEAEVRLHIVPGVGSVRLTALGPQHLQAHYKARLSAGLSARTVNYQHKIIHAALKDAVRWGLAARNVASLVQPPRVPRKLIPAMTVEHAKAFLKSVEDDRLYALYVVTLSVGLRRGEVLALRWQDVDLEKGTLAVRNTFSKVKGGWQLMEPKTPSSTRVIKLPAFAVDGLRQQKVSQLQERLQAGPLWKEQGFVFSTTVGTPIDGDNMRRVFQAHLRKADLPVMPFHALRHSSATLMLALGVSAKVVAEMLGHSRVGVTMDTYTHVLLHLQEEAAAKMDGLLTARA